MPLHESTVHLNGRSLPPKVPSQLTDLHHLTAHDSTIELNLKTNLFCVVRKKCVRNWPTSYSGL